MNELYFEDLAVGRRFGSGRIGVDADAIKSFAAQFDPQPFHLDEATASGTRIKGLAASGWHTASLTTRRRVGELRVEGEVLDVSSSKSQPGLGLAKLRVTTFNQHNEPVQIFTAILL